MNTHDPKNPYISCMVEASAGSGKTYQLSKRFLMLVGAGALPENILTMTFTIKAAQEMRARIITDATTLLVDQKEQELYAKNIRHFFAQKKTSLARDYILKEPLSPTEVAQEILSATQKLKILTIDSLFHEWVMRFFVDAFYSEKQTSTQHAKFTILESFETEELHEKAWTKVFADKSLSKQVIGCYQNILKVSNKIPMMHLKSRVHEIFRHTSYLFYLEKNKTTPFLQYSTQGEVEVDQRVGYAKLVQQLLKPLTTISEDTKKKDVYLEAIANKCLTTLIKERLLTKTLEVSKQTIRGKKREKFVEEISEIENTLQAYDHNQKKLRLNLIGKNLYEIYILWKKTRDELKRKQGTYEFSDLVEGSYNLFFDSKHSGVSWLIQKSIHHLLIDEFQDTSFLQWQIFSALSHEILSGHHGGEEQGFIPSVFIVGDKKQSIYGFREADPIVMDHAKDLLCHFDQVVIPLNHSYRTARLVLDFINELFIDHMDKDYQEHKIALMGDNRPVIPNYSQIIVRDIFKKNKEDTVLPVEQEARYVARTLHKYLVEDKLLVFDKKHQSFRYLKASDCCILYRNSTHVNYFEEALQDLGISYHKEESGGFFHRQEVQDLFSLLSFLVNPADLEAMLSLLKAPMIGVKDEDMLASLDKTLADEPSERCYHLLKDLEEQYPKIKDLFYFLEKAHETSAHNLLLEVEQTWKVTESYANLSIGMLEKEIVEKNVSKLIDVCLESQVKGGATLYESLAYLHKKKELDILSSARADHDAVHLMTIHKAKGLEFVFVGIVECGEPWFRFDRYWIKQASGLYYVDTYDAMPHGDQEFEDVFAVCKKNLSKEAIRLLYVALTRASQYLLITGHEGLQSSCGNFHQWMKEAIKKNSTHVVTKDNEYILTASQMLDYSISDKALEEPCTVHALHPAKATKIIRKEIEIINPHEQLSVPLLKQENIKQDGYLSRKALSFIGTFIHYALESYIRYQTLDISALWHKMVVGHVDLESELLQETQMQQLYHSVTQEITDTIDASTFQNLLKDSKECIPEMPISYMRGSYMIRGSVDLFVHDQSNDIWIVDYKTSAVPDTGELKEYCRMKGYHQQLKHYMEALKPVYPRQQIKGGVWLTKARELVVL